MSKMLDCIARNIKEYAQDAAFVALKSYEADMKFRVHNQGLNSEGNQIGNYKSKGRWKKKRETKGLQIGYVDLQYDGDFRDSLTTGQSKGQAVLGYTSDLSKKIHDGQTENFGVFSNPTTIELRDLKDRFQDELNGKIRKCGSR